MRKCLSASTWCTPCDCGGYKYIGSEKVCGNIARGGSVVLAAYKGFVHSHSKDAECISGVLAVREKVFYVIQAEYSVWGSVRMAKIKAYY